MPSRVAGGRFRERAVLVGGLVSAAALASAALFGARDPDLLGAGIVARAAGEVADGIRAEWARLARDGALLDGSVNERFTWPDGDALIAPASRAAQEQAGAEEPRHPAFDLLLAEARRRELAADAGGALELIADALATQHDAERAIDARLLQIRIAAGRGDGETAWTAFQALRGAAQDGFAARGGTSVLVIGALGALPAWGADSARAREALARIGDLWANDALVLPGAPPRGTAEFLRGPDPTRAALLRELERFGTLGDGVRAAEERRRGHDALGLIGDRAFVAVKDAEIELADLGDTLVVRRAAQAKGPRAARFVARAELERELVAAASAPLPPGFHVVFDRAAEPGKPRTAELVRPRTALAGDAFGFELHHDDPASLARAEAARGAALQIGLCVLATLVAGLTVFTWRALGRERKLADLRAAFVASVSHELRTPLASILLMAENLEQGTVPAGAEGRYHKLIRREAQRLRRLVDDVLDVSRLERGEAPRLRAEDVDVATFLTALEAEARERVDAGGGTLVFHGGDAPARLHADGEALRRAVLNLVDNAMKHSGGNAVELSASASGHELVLAVRDRGRGVPAARRAEIFAPFARLNGEEVADGTAAPGAGLGLAIVREIARAHGGSALVRDPDEGPGARFELRVPLWSLPGGAEAAR